MHREEARSGGLLGSLRQLAQTSVEVLHTRIELLATEVDEERARITTAVWLGAAGAFSISLGTLLGVLFLVVMFWDSHRLLVLGALAALFLLAGVTAMLTLRMRLTNRAPMFSQTLEELRRDRERLKPRIDANE
jgi:uncharacterized membrane protein YqjE